MSLSHNQQDNYTSRTSYTKQAFKNLISEAYAKQREAIELQYVRTFLVYLVLCFTMLLFQSDTIEDINDVLRIILHALLAMIAYKCLFYFPNRMLKVRYKLDGYIDVYSHLCHSPSSPINFLDEAINLEQERENLIEQNNELLKQNMSLIQENSELNDRNKNLNIENLKLSLKVNELELQLIRLHNISSNKDIVTNLLPLSPTYDDTNPLDW